MTKNIKVVEPFNLYKWAKNFKRIQDRFYNNQYKLRRIQQIEDFILLNNFTKIYHIEETKLDLEIDKNFFTKNVSAADLILVTHQGYSRYPCSGIIEQIQNWLNQCSHIYLCLNRHYLNIDSKQIDLSLPDEYLPSITSWLQQSLSQHTVVDLSRNYVDYGLNFTWSVPDRHYFIKK